MLTQEVARALRTLASKKSSWVRRKDAVEALRLTRSIPHAHVLPRLLGMLQGSAEVLEVQFAIAESLAPYIAYGEVRAALRQCLQENHVRFRIAAAQAFAPLVGCCPEALGLLVQAASTDPDEIVRKIAVMALIPEGGRPAVMEVLVRAARDLRYCVREAAVLGLLYWLPQRRDLVVVLEELGREIKYEELAALVRAQLRKLDAG